MYTSEARYKEAAQVLDRALGIIVVAANAHPLDRINLLNRRASADARQGEWLEAEEKLRLAVTLAEGAGLTDPALLRSVLKNYAIALRKNHHRREARAIENRVSALRPDPGAVAVVDVHELSSDLKARFCVIEMPWVGRLFTPISSRKEIPRHS
jgi:phosphoribosyl-dephospho-CoA transferase